MVKILVINCFPQNSVGSKRCEDLLSIVAESVDTSAIHVSSCNHQDELTQYLYQQPKLKGFYPSAMKKAQLVFAEVSTRKPLEMSEYTLQRRKSVWDKPKQPLSGEPTCDAFEFAKFMTQILQKLGVPVKAALAQKMSEMVNESFAKHAVDKGLSFKQVLDMIKLQPWSDMLPESDERKKMQASSLQQFCELDLVIVDGDPNLMPWQKEATNLVKFVYQVWKAQKSPFSGAGIKLLGSTVVAQIVQYLMINGPNVEPVFNGLYAGQGDRSTGNMCKADTTSDTIISGAVYLDNSTGNSYRYNKYMQCWRAGGSVGVLRNGSRKNPPRMFEAGLIRAPHSENRDSTKNYVQCQPEYFSHWLFKSLTRHEFVTRCDRLWDILYNPTVCNSNKSNKMGEIKPLCWSVRGVEVFEVNSGGLVAVNFPFLKYNVQTAEILKNFLEYHLQIMEVSSDIKRPWFEWLLLQGDTGLLDMQFLEASKYEPTAAPVFADLSSSWPGRPANAAPERSLSCPPLPQLASVKGMQDTGHQPVIPGPYGPQDYWQRTCGPQLLMRGPNGHTAVEPWESCPVSKIDRTMGVSRPRAQASTKFMMSATRYFNLQRGKSTSCLGFTEARTTRNYRRKTNRRKKSNTTAGDGGDITQMSGTKAIGTKSLANEIDIFSRRASHMTEPVKPMKRVLSFHETGDQLHRYK